MERQVLMWSVKTLTQKAEGGPEQDGETGVDVVSKSILSSLFEKLRDARDKTLVCKDRKPKKIA
jgi:hypothetical protein